MYSSVLCVLSASAFLLHSRPVEARPESYAIWAADSVIARGQGNGLTAPNGTTTVSYEHGEFQSGLELLYSMTGNQTYYDYIVTGASRIVADNGTIIGADYKFSDYSQDPIRTGPTFAYLYKTTGDEKWKLAMDTFHSQLMGQPRTPEGQFWHKERYYEQGWLDGIYMGDIFYATYVNMFQPTNTSAYEDIALQFDLMYDNTLQDPSGANYTGLMYHGYDYSQTAVWASPDRGHSPEVWIRAQGWYMMSLVDMIALLPASESQDTSTYHAKLQTLAPRILANADPETGVWWLVMTQPGREENYFESSGSAMFVYALLKAVRLGLLDDPDGAYVACAVKAYKYIIDHWVVENTDGTMDWENTVHVGSLDLAGDFDYYVSVAITVNDLKGVASFILASIEYEQLEL